MKKICAVLPIVLLFTCCNYRRPTFATEREGKTFPTMSLLLPDSTSYFNTENIPTGQPVVLFYFSPSCPYCRAQMTEMTQKMSDFKNVRFYFITFSKFHAFKKLFEEFKLEKYSNITVGLDYSDIAGKYFNLKGYPFTAIYTPQKKLAHAYLGKIPASLIKSELEN